MQRYVPISRVANGAFTVFGRANLPVSRRCFKGLLKSGSAGASPSRRDDMDF
jgi:hypothetical protein